MARRAASAAHAHFAEAYQHAAAGLRTPKTELWTEAREQHHLIELALYGLIVRARENLVIDDFARSVERSLQEQLAGFRMRRRTNHSGNRERCQAFQARRLHQIQRQIVRY